MSRDWPMPDPERTLHCIGDTHFGATPLPQFDAMRQRLVADDLARPSVPQVDHRLQLGDLTDNALATEDAAAMAWMESLGGTPHYTIGNHDLWGVRNSAAVVAAWGLPGKDYAVDLGYAMLLVLGPDILNPNLVGLTYSTTALDWLDAQLAAATKPCLIAAHAPLYNTVGVGATVPQYKSTDEFFYAEVDADIRAVLGAHDTAKAWISGHTHSPVTAPAIVKAETVGQHTLAAINTSCLAYTGKSKTDWTSRLVTMFVTVEDDRIETRFRDHGAHQWVGGGPNNERTWTVTF